MTWRGSETGGQTERVRLLSELSDEEFLRWARETGFGELAELMLWRWDPRECADEFPSSSDRYEGRAQTVLYGLRAGDDASRFAQRLRTNEGEIADYHLYAGSHVPCPRAVELARDRGLHPVTGTVSPWLHDS